MGNKDTNDGVARRRDSHGPTIGRHPGQACEAAAPRFGVGPPVSNANRTERPSVAASGEEFKQEKNAKAERILTRCARRIVLSAAAASRGHPETVR